MNERRQVLATGAVLLALGLTGCAGGPRSGSDQLGVSGPASVAPGAAGSGERTDIASASRSDLSAVFRANDVGDPERWAQIVIEYRPYPAGPAGTTRLTEVLTQFRAAPEDIAKITNAVTG